MQTIGKLGPIKWKIGIPQRGMSIISADPVVRCAALGVVAC